MEHGIPNYYSFPKRLEACVMTSTIFHCSLRRCLAHLLSGLLLWKLKSVLYHVSLKKYRFKVVKERKENEGKEKGLGCGRRCAFQSRSFHWLRLQDRAFVTAIQKKYRIRVTAWEECLGGVPKLLLQWRRRKVGTYPLNTALGHLGWLERSKKIQT